MMAEESKRPKSESKEDRISNLPDCLIQHILSFLPTTKQAIQTTVLSKRWHNQWTGVPVLIFNSNCKFCQNVLEFHNCSKIEKIHCLLGCFNYWDIHRDYYFDEIISLATRTHVEDLVLNICCETNCPVHPVPELFFDNTWLRKLGMRKCGFMPKGKVNWANLKELSLYRCSLTNEAIEHVLSGSPLLELVSISACRGCDKFVVTSKYLKRLVLESQELGILEISCPNLKQLSFLHPRVKSWTMLAQAIKNVLSVSSLLESMELRNCVGIGHLVISSESLKILVIDDVLFFSCLQVSCSKLEKLEFSCVLNFEKVEFMNLPSSVQVNLDLLELEYRNTKIWERLVKDILQQLHHVNELKLGRRFIELLPGLDWSATDDKLLTNYIKIHGEGNWRKIPKKLGLQRCWKSCMLRWRNYLRPGIKRGNITNDEGCLIFRLHYLLGDRWSLIAGRLPG